MLNMSFGHKCGGKWAFFSLLGFLSVWVSSLGDIILKFHVINIFNMFKYVKKLSSFECACGFT